MLTLLSAVNQYYIDMLSMHTKKSKHHRVRIGLDNASVSPYGYQRTEDPRKPPTVNEQEAAAVRLMFETYATADYSTQELADLLNDREYKNRSGGRFSKDTLADMLRNPFYCGMVVYKQGKRGDVGETFPGQHESIISEELWERCRQIRKQRSHVSKKPSQKQRAYLVAKLVRCHVCGRKLRVQSGYSGPYYRETSYSRGYTDCPHSNRGIHAATLHAQVGEIMRLLVLPEAWQADLKTVLGDDDHIVTLRNRRSRLTAERRRLQDAYIRGDLEDDEDIYRRHLSRIRRELEQMPTKTDLVRVDQAAQLIGSVGDVWDSATDEERHKLVRLLLKEVRVDVLNSRLLWLIPVPCKNLAGTDYAHLETGSD